MSSEIKKNPEYMARVVVSAGLFLLLFTLAWVGKDPSGEQIRSWIRADQFYESTIEKVATWIEERSSI